MSLTRHQIASITTLESLWPTRTSEWLSLSEREQSAGHRCRQRRREWLAGRWLCKQLIQRQVSPCESAAVPCSEIEIQSHQGQRRSAKPRVFIAGQMLPVDISITHSQDWIGVALSTCGACRVGVDLVPQSIASGHNLGIWLTEHERQSLRHVSDHAALSVFWSIKESVYKAANRGESFRPQQMEVRRSPSGRYVCHCQALSNFMECSINVSHHADHVFTITTIRNRSRTDES